MFSQSKLLSQGNVYVLIFAFVHNVVPLSVQWPLAQLFPADWAGGMGAVFTLFFLRYPCLNFICISNFKLFILFNTFSE
jgi:hypothetical protein